MATSREVFERENPNMKDEETVQRLIELFGNVLELEIIQSVALNCNYNMGTTSEILLEMSSSIGAVPKQPKPGKKPKQNTKQTNSYASAAHNQQPKAKDADVIIVSERVVNCTPGKMDRSSYSAATISERVVNVNCTQKMDARLYSTPSPKKNQNPPTSQRKSKKEQEFDRIILHVRQGSRILIFLRGLPGSGKSYLAKQIVDEGVGCTDYPTFILSADDFFINRRTGMYEYDRFKLSDAHDWNQKRASKNMSNGVSPIIIDNTNVMGWEMRPYTMMAVHFGYRIEIVEPFTHWAFNDKELARRNSHGVPRAKIKEMLDRYEKNITPHKLLMMWSLSYSPHLTPPVNRNYPPIFHNLQYNANGFPNVQANSFAVLPLIHNGNSPFVATYGTESGEKKNSNLAKVEVPEIIDLMDFENDVVFISDGTKSDEQQTYNPFDSIIMDTQANTDILKPNVWNSPEKHNLTNSADPSGPKMKKVRSYSLNISDTGASVTSLQETEEQHSLSSSDNEAPSRNATQIHQARNFYPKLDLSSWGLNENAVSSWESWDVVRPLNYPRELQETVKENLNLSANIQTSDSMTNTSSADFALLTTDAQNVNILQTHNRDINQYTAISAPTSPSMKTCLDKSSMTNEDVLSAALSRERDANDEKQIQELVLLFPGIPVDSLRDVYEKCKKDLNWAVDLLLDDSKEFLPALTNNQTEELASSVLPENPNIEIGSESIQANMEQLTISNKPENLDQKTEEGKEIKRYLEENVEINKDYYSEHILKIKSQKHGITKNSSQPCTSRALNLDAYYTGEKIEVSSDTDSDNFEPDIDFPESEEEEMMELNLGDGVVTQLETKFGFPEMFPQGFLPVVHVPVSLARQLYALYVESVLVQMENQNQVLDLILKEDEEFAKKLHMQEQALQPKEERKTPDLQEIMDEQVANKLYQKETVAWMKLTPDNLAARLTRQKLYSAFPTVDQTLLMEILHAHNNSYEQTIEVLLASTERDKVYDPDGTILEPPITETVVNEMKMAEEETKESVHAPDTPKSANEYREEASKHLQKHKELLRKAQQAYQSKQFPVAQFYSDLAKTHTQLYDQANNLAASAFLQEHSQRLQSFSTLDLHYLYVKEAIAALDMFIDTNIQLLQGTNKRCENLFVITGRGKRSEQGKSRIKPAVMARLRKRDIWYLEVNPGLLKIRVRQHSAVTSSIS